MLTLFFQTMGLDIADNTHAVSERVGSYSGTHSLRARYIELAIAYLESVADDTDDTQDNPKRKTVTDLSSSTPKSSKSGDGGPDDDGGEKDGDGDDDGGPDNDGDDGGDDEEEKETPEGRLSSLNDIIKTLTSWVECPQLRMDPFATPVNYRSISGDVSTAMHRWKMTGLMHFVNCSDCEGVWTHGQCIDIHEFFQVVIPFKKAIHNSKDTENVYALEHMGTLDSVFEYAVKNNGWVIRW